MRAHIKLKSGTEDGTEDASASNPKPLAPVGDQLTPSTSFAPDFSLSSRRSSCNSEQDEMLMRAIASKPQQQPNVLEAEKDDPNNPR